MKTKTILLSALVLGCTALTAQTNKKATVRIKKVENINGAEKIVDTTYTVDDASALKLEDGNAVISTPGTPDDKMKQIMIYSDVNKVSDDETPGEKRETSKTIVINSNSPGSGENIEIRSGAMSADDKALIEKLEKEMTDTRSSVANTDSKSMEGKTVIIKKVRCGAGKEEIDNVKEEISVTIINKIDLRDASPADLEKLGRPSSISDNKLNMDKMEFYPNPSNGKFNLRFNLKNKGNTSVNVMNTEGKTIYTETLSNFSGTYDKEIDISKNPKGTYFIKVEQGAHAQLKKIVLE